MDHSLFSTSASTVTHVASIRKILSVTDRDVMAHIVRLIVLYEDMKIEYRLMHLPEIKALDEVNKYYRVGYLLRRNFATLLEVDSALIQLNRHATFKRDLKQFQTNPLRDWKAAIEFFAKKKTVLKSRRHAYGGHFGADVSKHILGLLDNDSDGSVGELEVRLSDDRSFHYVFKFAWPLVSVGLLYGSKEKQLDSTKQVKFMEENVTLVKEAIRHAALAISALADYYILPTFGLALIGPPRPNDA